MGILSWILFGLVVGVIAKLLMPGRDPGGFIVTILLGIAGALVGGFIGRAMGFYEANQGASWIMSILGAILLLLLYRMMVRRRVYDRGRSGVRGLPASGTPARPPCTIRASPRSVAGHSKEARCAAPYPYFSPLLP